MGNRELRAISGAPTETDAERSFPALLKQYRSEIERALPRHVSADRICRIALTAFRDNPALRQCSPVSIFASVLKASQLGLEIGLNGHAYLVPYGDEATFVIGWRGLLELANRTGRIAAWTGVVHAGDTFEFQLGDSPFLRHIPGDEDDPEAIQYTYAVGRVRGSEWPILSIWSAGKILKHRDRYNKVGRRHYSHTFFEAYARKLPLLEVLKYLPTSAELETAVALNDAAEIGAQKLTIDAALGEYVPPTTAEPEREAKTEPVVAPPSSSEESAPATSPPSSTSIDHPAAEDEPEPSESQATDRESVLAKLASIKSTRECEAQMPAIMDLVRGIKDIGVRKELYAVASRVAVRFGKGGSE